MAKSTSVQTSNTIVRMFKKQSEESIKVKLARWIMYENVPFNVLQSDYFKDVMTSCVTKVLPLYLLQLNISENIKLKRPDWAKLTTFWR